MVWWTVDHMSSKRRTTARPARVEVYNPAPHPVMVTSTGVMCPGSTHTFLDPTDPRTAELIAAGELVVKENQ